MALSVTTAIKDEISLLVVNKPYASCTTDQALAIDKAAARAFFTVDDTGRAFGMLDADSPPAEWQRWLVRLGALEAVAQFKPEREPGFRVASDRAEDDALSSFNKYSVDSADATPIGFTTQSIRRYVMENCMNMSPRLKPSVGIIDQEIRNMILTVWGDADWHFKRKRVTISISVLGAVTTDPSVVIGSIPDNKLKYTVDSTTYSHDNSGYCLHVSDQQMNEYKARTLTAGRPEAFRMLKASNAVVFIFSRTPDQVYTAEAEVVIASPVVTTVGETDTAIALFPNEFQHVLKQWTLGKVLQNIGETRKGQPILDDAESTVLALLPLYSDPGGDPDNDSMYPSRVNGLGPAPWGGIGGNL